MQSDKEALDYRGFNINAAVMLDLAEEITGKRELPRFSRNIIYDEDAACYLRPLHEMLMKGTGDLGKEETLLFLIAMLIQNYGQPFERCIPECRQEIEKACEFIEQHYKSHIYLEKLLVQGTGPLDAAIQTGFFDQSHFTNYFRSFIGLAPGIYRDIFCERDDKKDGGKNGT